jgi:hypothetical protein
MKVQNRKPTMIIMMLRVNKFDQMPIGKLADNDFPMLNYNFQHKL